MKRRTIAALILLDLAFLGAVGFQGWTRYKVLQGEMKVVAAEENPEAPPPPVQSPVPVPAEEPVDTISVSTPSLPSAAEEAKIGRTFVFYSSKAASVQLVGDFNQWTPQDFRKKGSGRWEISVTLSPGDYSYNFVVDGIVMRDRNQRRTDAKGRSLLTVAP